jgi:hypothetical protein
MKTRITFILFQVLFMTTHVSRATIYYWVNTGSGNWSTASNWSTTSGGAGGTVVPGTNDEVVFDRSGTSCTLTGNVTVSAIRITAAGSFTGTIVAGTYTINVTYNTGGSSAGRTSTFAKGTISSTFGTGGIVFSNNNSSVYFSGTTFSIPVSGTSAYLLFNGSTFNSPVTLTKTYTSSTGLADDYGTGGNTFTAALSLTNNSTRSCTLILGTTAGKPDVFNGTVTLTASNAGSILLAQASKENQFNGNITFNNTGSGSLTIGSKLLCSSTLASGKTLSVGTFSSGLLRLLNFTQSGSTTPQTLTLTGTATLQIGDISLSTVVAGCTFESNVNFTAPYIAVSASTFKGTSTFKQNATTGTSVNSGGGNTFNDDVTFSNTGSVPLNLATVTGDSYVKNAIYDNTGTISPMNATTASGPTTITNTYQGNISLTASNPMTFPGKTLFSGSAAQSFNGPSSVGLSSFSKMEVNKSAGSVTLNTPVNITGDVTFTSGNILTTATNYINFAAGATATSASNVSYVDGPVRKTGANAFTFPVGNAGVYRSIGMSAPGSTSDVFTAQYYRTPQLIGTNKASTLATLSNCEYWTLDRTSGTSNVSVTLSWNSSECNSFRITSYVANLNDLRVSRWNGSQWVDHGNDGLNTTATAASGTVTSSAAITAFSPFVLASSSTSNPLPIVLKDFQATLVGNSVKCSWETATEINNDHFTLERSENGTDFYEMAQVKGAGNKNSSSLYSYWDERAAEGISYYRLKQTDFDGTTSYLGVRTVENKEGKPVLTLYPNPVAPAEIIRTNYTGAAKIISSTGQEMFTITNALEVVLPKLASGVYIFLTADGRVEKLMVR